MNLALRTFCIAALLACASPAHADPDGPLYPISPGSPIWVDANGDLWFCGSGGGPCLPLGDSEPPIEP